MTFLLPALLLSIMLWSSLASRGEDETSIRLNPRQRRLAEHSVSTMNGLWNKTSNGRTDFCSECNVGKDIMANGDATTLSAGEYKCSGGTCANADSMLYIDKLHGSIQCGSDDASCTLHGESKRRGMYIEDVSDGSNTLTIRGIRFFKGSTHYGAGVEIYNSTVDIVLCVFESCHATNKNDKGGGG